jgi:hypothetical protein
MPRMIPPVCEGTTSPGEPRVFAVLRDQAPEDWTVLYSLDIAPWNGNKQTEIDFLIIIPDLGLLCIEVKGNQRIEYVNGVWYMGKEQERRGPFKQADDARFALLRRMKAADFSLGVIPVQRCVIFPLVAFELPPNISVHPWEFLDAPDFEKTVQQGIFASFLQTCLARSNAHQNRSLGGRLTDAKVEGLLQFLRPTVRNEPSFKKQEEIRLQELQDKLRMQQKPVLNLVQDNPRVVVDGGAGTGKTLIAMGLARQLAAKRKRVGLFCYQAGVGRWMEKQIGVCPGLVKGQFAERLQEMFQLGPPAEPEALRNWLETDLPRAAMEKLQQDEASEAYIFDALILDEAQDLLSRAPWWELVGLLLRGGLKDGCWVMLGDFKHQILLGESGQAALDANLEWLLRECRPVKWHLRENCRNTAIIGNSARALAVLESGVAIYDGFLRGAGNPDDFRHRTYADDQDQARILAEEIEYWRDQGYDWSHITILSGKEDGSVAERIKSAKSPGPLAELQKKLRPLREHEHGLRFGHVDEFKGLESKVIILTDVHLAGEMDKPALRKNLFYTGLTRSLQGRRFSGRGKPETGFFSGRTAGVHHEPGGR